MIHDMADLTLYQQVVETAAVPIFAIDSDHNVIVWNHACAQMTGVPAADVLHQRKAWRGFYAEQRITLADLVLDGKLHELMSYYPTHRNSPFTTCGIQAESWLPNVGGMPRYLLFDATPLLNSTGETVAVVETIYDITTRKKLETDLQRSQADALTRSRELDILYSQVEKAHSEWEAVLNCMQDLVLLVDNKDRIKQCNRIVADLLGRDYFEIIGNNWRQLLLDPAIVDADAIQDDQGEILFKPTGRWFLLRTFPIEGGSTGISGNVVTMHDLTDIKKFSNRTDTP